MRNTLLYSSKTVLLKAIRLEGIPNFSGGTCGMLIVYCVSVNVIILMILCLNKHIMDYFLHKSDKRKGSTCTYTCTCTCRTCFVLWSYNSILCSCMYSTCRLSFYMYMC